MKPYHTVTTLEVVHDHLHLIVDGKEYRFPWATISPSLAQACLDDRKRLELSPSGYGIHWPVLDEDVSIDGLIGVQHNIPLKDAA